VPAQSRLIATILATFVCLSPSAASELPTTMPHFTGEVITLHEGANTFDLTSQGPHGLVIVATYPEYFPNDHSLILTMASTKMADGVSETSEIVPVSDFKFPWRRNRTYDFERESMFVEYPHDGEYHQAVVFAREPERNGFSLSVYVASRALVGEHFVPSPVDMVKLQLARNEETVPPPLTEWVFKPVAVARSRHLYVNALEALACEVGVDIRDRAPAFDRQSCDRAPLNKKATAVSNSPTSKSTGNP